MQAEVPLEIGLHERRDESAGGGVDVDRDVAPRSPLELVERGADLLDRLVAAVERRPEDRYHSDRVLVAQRDRLARAPRWNRSPSIGASLGSTSQ